MLEAILIGLVAVIGLCDYITGTSMVQRPIVLGPLVGLILGDVTQGVMIGASLELIFIGVMYIGGAVPINVNVGGVVATALAIKTGAGVEVALALAVPVGALFSVAEKGYYMGIQYILVKFDKACRNARDKTVQRLHFLCFSIWSSFYFIITFCAVQFGADTIDNLVQSIPERFIYSIEAGVTLLPALGFALLLNNIWNRKIAVFFFIGFAMAAFLGMDLIGIAVIATCIGILFFQFGSGETSTLSSISDEPSVNRLLTKRDLNKIFWRSFTLEASFTYERFQATGYTYSVIPALRKFYKDDKEGLAGALTRNVTFVNTSPNISTLLMGSTCAVEEQYSQDKESMDPKTIIAIRSAMMGPIAGVGDAIFWGILRTVAAGIAIAMGLNGSVLAPIVFLLVFNVPHVLMRYYGLHKSYQLGSRFIAKLSESRLLERLSLCAGIVGLMVVGGMTSSFVWISTPLEFNVGGLDIVIQEFLDSILPGALSLIAVFTLYKLIKKQVKVVYLMIGALALGILLAMIGIL